MQSRTVSAHPGQLSLGGVHRAVAWWFSNSCLLVVSIWLVYFRCDTLWIPRSSRRCTCGRGRHLISFAAGFSNTRAMAGPWPAPHGTLPRCWSCRCAPCAHCPMSACSFDALSRTFQSSAAVGMMISQECCNSLFMPSPFPPQASFLPCWALPGTPNTSLQRQCMHRMV